MGRIKQVSLDMGNVVADTFHKVNDMVRKILDEHPEFDFFDIFYRVHLVFVHAYISAILNAMDELGKVSQRAKEFVDDSGMLARVLSEVLNYLSGKGYEVVKVNACKEVSDVLLHRDDPLHYWWDITVSVWGVNNTDDLSRLQSSLREHLRSVFGDDIMEKYRVFLWGV